MHAPEVANTFCCSVEGAEDMAYVTWAKYRLFPYERVLGHRELAALSGKQVNETIWGVAVPDEASQSILERSTFFEEVVTVDQRCMTEQLSVERGHGANRGAERIRQETRYGLHGLHEYKGKFNPQIVRALINAIDLEADFLIDPFCGSGTSLVEAMRLGIHAVGVDRSPIAAIVSEAKTRSLCHPRPSVLRREFSALVRDLSVEMKEAQQTISPARLESVLGEDEIRYLEGWFPREAWAAVSVGIAGLVGQRETTARLLAKVVLSSILRSVSMQLPEDLRVRRRREPFVAPSVWELFVEAADSVDAGLEEMLTWNRKQGIARVILGSADEPGAYGDTTEYRRRLLLTSPPYATALPYIDTDRLSIIALGLGSTRDVRSLEMNLVGSREWRKAEERLWRVNVVMNQAKLPLRVTSLVAEIEERNRDGEAGFRRVAVPYLLYRYFAKMRACMDAWSQHLLRGERAILIVGNNRTTAGGEEVVIRTPELLGEVASARGFKVEELIPLESWPRYGLHGRNGVSGEDAVVLTRL